MIKKKISGQGKTKDLREQRKRRFMKMSLWDIRVDDFLSSGVGVNFEENGFELLWWEKTSITELWSLKL